MLPMNIMRKLAYGMAVSLLSLATFTGIYLSTLSLKLTNREAVKRWPEAAGTYEQLPAAIVQLVKTDANGQNQTIERALDSGLIKREDLVAALNRVLPPDYWRTKTEQAIDAVYDFLEGKSPKLEFQVSFSDRIDAVTDELANLAAKQLSSAPECDKTDPPSSLDPLTLTCLPPGVTTTDLAASFKRQLQSSPQLGQTLSGERVFGGSLDQGAIANLPRYYQPAKNIGIYFAVAVFVLGLLVIVLSRPPLDGLRKVGRTLFGAGIIAWVGFFIGKTMLENGITIRGDGPEQQFARDVALPLAKQVIGDISLTGMWVSITVVILGALAWLAAYSWHKIHHHNEASSPVSLSAPADQLPPLDKRKRH